MKKISILLVILIITFISGCNEKEKQAEENRPVSAVEPDIHTAAATGNIEAIKKHIGAGTDLNTAEPSNQSSPLITAVAFNQLKAMNALIEGGADLNYVNADKSTALHTACVFGRTEAAKILIDAGADLDLKNKDGSTALHTAAFFGYPEIVKALLANGADKSIENKTGQTAYEIIEMPFENVKPVYDVVGQGLKPLGIVLDYEKIKAARPVIAEMLK